MIKQRINLSKNMHPRSFYYHTHTYTHTEDRLGIQLKWKYVKRSAQCRFWSASTAAICQGETHTDVPGSASLSLMPVAMKRKFKFRN